MGKSILVSKVFLAGIIISALSFSTLVLDPTLTPRFVSFALFSVFAMLFIYRAVIKLHIDVDIVSGTYLLFTLFCITSLAWANTRSEAFFESAKVLLSFVAFSLTWYCIKKDWEFFIRGLYKFSIAIVFIGACFAIYQYSKITVFDKDALYAVTSINGHKNLYASFLFLNLFFLICGVIKFTGFNRFASYAAIIITLIVLVFIKTKAVWLGMSVSAVIFGLIYLTRKIKVKLNFYIVLISCLILANAFFACIVPLGIEKGIGHNRSISNTATPEEKAKELDNERLMLWQKTFDMIRKHPLIGVGMGNWQIYFPDATLQGIWRAEDLNFTFQRPHNDPLWILSETGWIGFNLFLIFIFSLILFLFRAIRPQSEDLKLSIEMILCITFICGFFTISFFDFPKERVEHLIWLNIILGISYSHVKSHSNVVPYKKIIFSKTVMLGGVLIMLVVTAIGVLRYKGEYYTRKMYDARATKQELKAIDLGAKALSFVYSIDPTSVPIHWYMGNSYANLGNYEKAQNDFILAYGDNPYNRNVLNDLGSSYALSNKTDLAKKRYEEALRISPRFDDPKLNLAAIYIKEKQFGKADTCLRTMFKDSERRTQYQKMVDAFKGY